MVVENYKYLVQKKKREENQRGNFIFQNKNQFIVNTLELRSNS